MARGTMKQTLDRKRTIGSSRFPLDRHVHRTGPERRHQEPGAPTGSVHHPELYLFAGSGVEFDALLVPGVVYAKVVMARFDVARDGVVIHQVADPFAVQL